MSDKVRTVLFLLLIISCLGYYGYRYYQVKPADSVPDDFVPTQDNSPEVAPLKLKLAHSVYYALAVDWDGSGVVTQGDILKGEDSLLAAKDANGKLRWVSVVFGNPDPLNDYEKTLIRYIEFNPSNKIYITQVDPEFRALELIRVVNNVSGQLHSQLNQAGIASISMVKPKAEDVPNQGNTALEIGYAILNNNSRRAIYIVPMSVLPSVD